MLDSRACNHRRETTAGALGLMVDSRSCGGILHFLGWLCSMEMAVLLLLSVPLTAASPLRPTHRSESETFPGEVKVQALGVRRSEDTEDQHVRALRIIPFHSEDKHLDVDALKRSDSVGVKLRPRRAPQRGCHLGTCQLHNLANTLYQISKTSGKDESKSANDPQGFGR